MPTRTIYRLSRTEGWRCTRGQNQVNKKSTTVTRYKRKRLRVSPSPCTRTERALSLKLREDSAWLTAEENETYDTFIKHLCLYRGEWFGDHLLMPDKRE